jgi:hypothetical protein
MSTLIRASAFLVVLAVAGIAFWISFEHIVHVARAYGEGGAIACAYPGVIDGPLIAASLSMWDAARRGARTPSLAWWVLGAGIAVSLAANVDAGAQRGIGGGLVAVWPSIALVGSFELLMQMARAGHAPSAQESGETVADAVPVDAPADVPVDTAPMGVPTVPAPVPRTVAARAPRRAPVIKSRAPERMFQAEVERGELPSIRRVKQVMHVGTPRAQEIRSQLAQLMEARPEAA